MPIFCLSKGSTALIKIMKWKMGVTVLVFAVELQKVRTKCIFSDFWERTGASFKIECMWKGEESIKKSVFYRIYIEISHLGHNVIKKAFKWKSDWVSTNRGSPWGSRTRLLAYCLRYAHSQHIESHLDKKQQQEKNPIAFLFSQLRFNNVTSHALFYGGHLVMRRKRCAVQNQGITLNPVVKWICLVQPSLNRLIQTAICNCFSRIFKL